MYHKIKTYMEEHGMIEAGDMVCAGVSGGGDSMAMLSALKRYQEEIPFSLCAVHVNHGIRGEEAMRDENLVKDICENGGFLSFPIIIRYRNLQRGGKAGWKKPDGL